MATNEISGEVKKKLEDMSLEKDNEQPKSTDIPETRSSSVAASLREKPAGPLKTPIVDPVESAKPTVAPELTEDQQAKYDSLLETVKTWKEIPSTKGKEGPISESEIMWLTRECLLRYLRATKWSTADAAKRLLGTLTWRREYGVEELTGDHVSPENETGKQIILGFDIAARPCLYLNPGRQNTEPSPRQVQHLVFMLERVINFLGPGQETLALLINFKSSKSRSNTAPGLGQGREVLNILQTHYPERLGRALIINIPWVVNGFFKLITPFIDPLTRQKLKFNDDMRQHVPPQQLWNEFHGDLEFEYDHAMYWPTLLKLCAEKQAEQRERWIKADRQYGESEAYLKGGAVSGISGANETVVQEEAAQEAAVPPPYSEKGKDTTPVDSPQPPSEGEPAEAPQDATEVKVPLQSHGAQVSGNMDTTAQVPNPVLTTEGDRA